MKELKPKPFVFLGWGPNYAPPAKPIIVYSNWNEVGKG